MQIGERLKALREHKHMSQGDIEKRTGLLRSYISRVENGHNVPAIETLEKFARAMNVPMYQLFYEGEKPPPVALKLPNDNGSWGSKGKDARTLDRFRRLLARTSEADQKLLLTMAQNMAAAKAKRTSGKSKG